MNRFAQNNLNTWFIFTTKQKRKVTNIELSLKRTGESDVEATVCIGMISQKFQSGHVATGSDGWRQHISRKGAKNWRLCLAAVFNGQEVKLFLHAQVVEG